MSKYIDADLIPWDSECCGHPNCKDDCANTRNGHSYCKHLTTRMWQVDEIPEADVKEVIHGEWVKMDVWNNIFYHCSNCGFLDARPNCDRFKYCPMCGADMSGNRSEKSEYEEKE